MNFFSPSRPRIGSSPVFFPDGEAFGVLPDLFIRPMAEGHVEISGWFCIAKNRASRKHYQLPIGNLSVFIHLWLEDPEATAKEYFKWEKAKDEPKGQGIAKPVAKAEDFDF